MSCYELKQLKKIDLDRLIKLLELKEIIEKTIKKSSDVDINSNLEYIYNQIIIEIKLLKSKNMIL